MGAGNSPVVVVLSRLKREHYKETKHDAHFSKWQILIGPNDWEDHSLGKEGVTRYRVYNLPNKSVPGIYELGIVITRSKSGREKIIPDDIVVVYLGQADNVRSRLQRYGRSGAHLCFTHPSTDCKPESPSKGAGLFEDIFSRGYSIVYRWAPMKTKRDAEETEARLLDTFDYAWNKGSNCERRPDDIFLKISEPVSKTRKLLKISRILFPYSKPKVGIEIEGNKNVLQESTFNAADVDKGQNFLSKIFKLSRSRPRMVSESWDTEKKLGPICGLIINDGKSCTRPPLPGRKRCEEHKGKRVYGFNAKPMTKQELPNPIDESLDSFTTTCNVNLGNGTFCEKQPISGRKRCEEHKGMRITALIGKVSEASATCGLYNQSKLVPVNDFGIMVEDLPTVCGATLKNGSFCKRKVKGCNKCWQHAEEMSKTSSPTVNASSVVVSHISSCGVTLEDGSICERSPVFRRKRCEVHKGMRVTSRVG